MEMLRDHRRAGSHAHFGENPAKVSANCPCADLQYLCDRLVGKTSGDQADNFLLTRAQTNIGLPAAQFVTKNHIPGAIDLGFGDYLLGVRCRSRWKRRLGIFFGAND